MSLAVSGVPQSSILGPLSLWGLVVYFYTTNNMIFSYRFSDLFDDLNPLYEMSEEKIR